MKTYNTSLETVNLLKTLTRLNRHAKHHELAIVSLSYDVVFNFNTYDGDPEGEFFKCCVSHTIMRSNPHSVTKKAASAAP